MGRLADALLMGVMTVERRVLLTDRRLLDLLTVGRLADALLMGVMTVARRVLLTDGRLLDLLTVGRLTAELRATLLVLELLFVIGETMVRRCEVDEPVDGRVTLRLATSTVRLTGREKDGREVETLGADLVAGADLTDLEGEAARYVETLGADRGAGLGADLGADLTDLEGEARRDVETLGAGLDVGLGAGLGAGLAAGRGAGRLAGLDGARAAGRDARAGAEGRDFGADLGADLLAGADLAEGLDDLPLGGAALPNVGPKVIITVTRTANSVFSTCLVNIFLAPFPARYSGSLKKQHAPSDPSGQTELFCFA